MIPRVERQPCFEQFLNVLRRQTPDHPVLFELFLNPELYALGAPEIDVPEGDRLASMLQIVHAYKNFGYDYATLPSWQLSDFGFPSGEIHRKESISLNEGAVIRDRESFEAYNWLDVDDVEWCDMDALAEKMPADMKGIPMAPCGILENVTRLVGYESLCYLLVDDEELAKDVFDAVGSRLLAYYQRMIPFEVVGAIIYNDDWGFKTQTMISPADMRRYVFPWVKQIVAAAHAVGKPAILHSCGNLETVYDDIIDDIAMDAKHSWEDTIVPVEQAYDRWGQRIAIMGGLDLDFLCRSTPQVVYERSRALIQKTACCGYALGSGNSIPPYVPQENYFAMISAAGEG